MLLLVFHAVHGGDMSPASDEHIEKRGLVVGIPQRLEQNPQWQVILASLRAASREQNSVECC